MKRGDRSEKKGTNMLKLNCNGNDIVSDFAIRSLMISAFNFYARLCAVVGIAVCVVVRCLLNC